MATRTENREKESKRKERNGDRGTDEEKEKGTEIEARDEVKEGWTRS